MGNNISRTAAESRLSKALPSVRHESALALGTSRHPAAAFQSETERKRLIGCILAIASNNGKQDLERHDFALVYSRRDNGCVAASIIAIRDGVIEAKIESFGDGKDEAEAFMALRVEIEKRLDKLLRDVPSLDAPPAYESSEREMDKNEKVQRHANQSSG